MRNLGWTPPSGRLMPWCSSICVVERLELFRWSSWSLLELVESVFPEVLLEWTWSRLFCMESGVEVFG